MRQFTFILLGTMLAGAPAFAAQAGDATRPLANKPLVLAQTTPAPVPGANSFTEGQAKDRIIKAGYTDVSALRKDDQGIWRGTATKAGKQVNVGVDFKGNVTES